MRMNFGGINPGALYKAMLDDVPFGRNKYLSFSAWWNKIIISFKGKHISRKDLVLTMANQDGGAHVDPTLDKNYADLTRNNALGWTYGNHIVSKAPIEGAEFASIRQIAHEFISSIKNPSPIIINIPKCPSVTLNDIKLKEVPTNKVGRNDPCPCGSGIKYKKCHLMPNNRL